MHPAFADFSTSFSSTSGKLETAFLRRCRADGNKMQSIQLQVLIFPVQEKTPESTQRAKSTTNAWSISQSTTDSGTKYTKSKTWQEEWSNYGKMGKITWKRTFVTLPRFWPISKLSSFGYHITLFYDLWKDCNRKMEKHGGLDPWLCELRACPAVPKMNCKDSEAENMLISWGVSFGSIPLPCLTPDERYLGRIEIYLIHAHSQ